MSIERFILPTGEDTVGSDAGGFDSLPVGLAPRILDEAADGVLVADVSRSGQPIVYVNAAFSRMTGYAAAEALGRNCRFLQNGDRAQPEIALMREAITAGLATTLTLRNYRRDGSIFWNEVRLAPLTDRGAAPAQYYVGFQRDVTARIEANSKLHEAMEAVNTANRAKARLLTAVNHEFRTPIGIIAGFAELLLSAAKQRQPEPRAVDYLQDIHAAAFHLLGLVKDTQSYIEMTELPQLPKRAPVRLLAATREAVRLVAARRVGGARICVQAAAGDPTVCTDRALFSQALTNLVGEMVDRAPARGQIDVRVGMADRSACVELRCGALVLPEATVDEMLEPFATGGDIYARGLEGAKINVAVAASILQLLAGELRLESNAADGTRFIVSLPMDAG